MGESPGARRIGCPPPGTGQARLLRDGAPPTACAPDPRDGGETGDEGATPKIGALAGELVEPRCEHDLVTALIESVEEPPPSPAREVPERRSLLWRSAGQAHSSRGRLGPRRGRSTAGEQPPRSVPCNGTGPVDRFDTNGAKQRVEHDDACLGQVRDGETGLPPVPGASRGGWPHPARRAKERQGRANGRT